MPEAEESPGPSGDRTSLSAVPDSALGPAIEGLPAPPLPEHQAAANLPRVAGYTVLGLLGRGGMGAVYKALQIGLNRLVALKIIQSGAQATAEEVARFRAEAEAVARLQHPNIVQIHEVGECDGCSYLVLELVPGGNLKTRIEGVPIPARQAAELLLPLARAMSYAHQRDIVHRDLKPANVLLTLEGVPKIADFGLAKRIDADLGQTQSGAVMGTPGYMAPEQVDGRIRDIGPATDVYALGVILYELLTGRPPFQSPTVLDTLEQVRWQEPVRPRSLQPKVPPDLETICLKCLAKEPQQRYGSAAALAEDLNRFLQGEPVHARSSRLLDLLGRAINRSQYAIEFHTSSTLALFFAPIPFLAQLVVLLLPEAAYSRAALGVSLGSLLAFLGLLFWRTGSAGLFATKTASRQFWAMWIGNVLAASLLAYVCLATIGGDAIRIYPMWSIVFGLTLFMMGSSYWGRLYLAGLAFFALAFVMPVRPRWAPLEFALLQSATLFAIGVHLHHLARDVRTEADRSGPGVGSTSGDTGKPKPSGIR